MLLMKNGIESLKLGLLRAGKILLFFYACKKIESMI